MFYYKKAEIHLAPIDRTSQVVTDRYMTTPFPAYTLNMKYWLLSTIHWLVFSRWAKFHEATELCENQRPFKPLALINSKWR